MHRLVYNILFALVFPLLIPHFLWRMGKRGGYRQGFGQRFGTYEPQLAAQLREPRIWIHAVSVGEVHIALKFIRTWTEHHPDDRFVLSYTTSTARAITQKHLPEPHCGIYFPIDFPPILSRVFRTLNPRALILVEAEVWPNLVHRCHRNALPVILLNGRLSDRSFRRMHTFRWFTRKIMHLLDLCCMQTPEEQRRIIALGARPETVHALNSAKYDVAERQPEHEHVAAEALAATGITPEHTLLLGGSTWPGDEADLVAHFRHLRSVYPGLRLALVPRHVERTPQLLAELDLSGLTLARRSQPPQPNAPPADVFLLDTTGELLAFYSAADIIYIGKSLYQKGGQNPIEPALFAKPIIVGPNMHNFPRIMEEFLAAEAIVQIADRDELLHKIQHLLHHPETAATLGHNARALVERQRGALHRSCTLIETLLATQPS